jgi:hypothetical protein
MKTKCQHIKLTWDIIEKTKNLLTDVYLQSARQRVPFGRPQSPPVKVAGECLAWTGTGKRAAYGKFILQNIAEYGPYTFGRAAHIVAWMIDHCEEPDPDLEIGHLCGQAKCVNPDHLQQMTHEQNMQLATMGRQNPDPGNQSWKVSFPDLTIIYKMFFQLGWPRKVIAYHYRLLYSASTIQNILAGNRYSHHYKKYLDNYETWKNL